MAQQASKKGTIVRFSGWFNSLPTVRATFGVLEVVAPGIGARIAEPMWFRVPGMRSRFGRGRSNRRPSFDATGTPFEVSSQGHVVRGQFWGHGPVVHLLHGWGGDSAQMRQLVGPLVATGHRVVAHDTPSHGRSDAGISGPRRSNAVEMGRSLSAVADRFGQPHAIVAHSMGVLATMLALREGWVTCVRLVLISPVTGVPDFSAMFRDHLGFGARTQSRIEERARRRVGYPVAELDVRLLARTTQRPQLFVVHDELDQETPYAASADLVGSWSGARLLSTTGLGHRRILRDTGVAEAVAWFVSHGPVPLDLGDDRATEPRGSRRSETLAGVEDSRGVQGVLDRSVHVHHVGSELQL